MTKSEKGLVEKLLNDRTYYQAKVDFQIKSGNVGHETIAHTEGYLECLQHVIDLVRK